MRLLRTGWWRCAGWVGVVCAAAAQAQPVAVEEFTARSIARVALIDLRLAPATNRDDFAIAELLLGLAQEVNPRDTEIIRRRLEAAGAAGDRQRVQELLRRLHELEPADTVVQLRLITETIASRYQTVASRLEAYARFIADERFDASVRSRLALDSALLRREAGDMDGFVADLTRATQLDATNKEAATIAAQYFAERVDDPAGRSELLVNLLLADPIDPNVHLALARELASGGAFVPARRFHDSARLILAQTGGRISEELEAESIALQWLVEGPAAVVAQLNGALNERRTAAMRALQMRLEANLPVEGLPRPEDVRLPIHIEVLRVLAADAAGDRATVQAAIFDLVRTAAQHQAQLTDAATRPQGVTDAQAIALARARAVQTHTLRLLVGEQVDQVREDLVRLQSVEDDQVLGTLRAWVALRDGETATARQRLEALAASSTFARLGLGVALEAAGQRAAAAGVYRDLIRADPTGQYALWARSRLQALGGTDRDLFPQAERLSAIAAGVPGWVDTMIVRPGDVFALSVEPASLTLSPLARNELVVRLRNVSPIPVAVGADRLVSTRLLVTPKLEHDLASLTSRLSPEVIEVDRRLRLRPQEQFEVKAWVDPGLSGWVLESMATRTVRLRWSVVQGFMLKAQGTGWTAGPMCVTTSTPVQTWPALDESLLSFDELAARVRAAGDASLPALILVVRSHTAEAARQPVPPEALAPVVEAFVERYAEAGTTARMMMIAALPHQRLAPVMAPFDEMLTEETDPRLMALVLGTRAVRPDEPMLLRAREAEDGRVRRLAELLADRLAVARPTYSRLGLVTSGGGTSAGSAGSSGP